MIFIPNGADEVLRQFLLEYERTDEHMDESEDREEPIASEPRPRLKLINLFYARRVKHLTQAELALKAGITRRSVTAIETGTSEPSVFTALSLADALDMTVEELFRLEQQPSQRSESGYWTLLKRSRRVGRSY